jgi:predicted secreted protein
MIIKKWREKKTERTGRNKSAPCQFEVKMEFVLTCTETSMVILLHILGIGMLIGTILDPTMMPTWTCK